MGLFLPIGERLAEERQRLRMNQTDFASVASVTRKTLFGYESGARAPDAGALAAWAEVGLDVLYVVKGERTGSTASEEQPSQLSDQHRLQLAIEAVEEGLSEMRRKLPPAKKAELIVAAYELMAEPEQAKNNVIRLVRVAA